MHANLHTSLLESLPRDLAAARESALAPPTFGLRAAISAVSLRLCLFRARGGSSVTTEVANTRSERH